MTGPEHYQQAEQILARSSVDAARGSTFEAGFLAETQVHATLALAAATAIQPAGEDFVGDRFWPEFEAWAAVCAVVKPEAAS